MRVGCKGTRGARAAEDAERARLCRKLIELFQRDLVSSHNGRNDFASAICQHIPMGMGNLLNQMVGPQHAQLEKGSQDWIRAFIQPNRGSIQ